MATTEQSIRVTAKGEFGQLQRGLKDLQGDLKDVLGEINKGARKGGIFDDSSLRALDVYKKRFEDTMGGLDDQFQKQNKLVDSLSERMKKANMVEKLDIAEQIKARERELDVMRKQMVQAERLYSKRTGEAGSYDMKVPGGKSSGSSSSASLSGGSGGGAGAFAVSAISGATSKILGAVGTVAKVALGLAGIGSMLAMVQEAYQTAYTRQVGSLDTAQRIRGGEFRGTGASMFNRVSATGRRDRMGYTEAESWGLQDAYSSKGGALSSDQQFGLQKFSRGYGLDATQVGSMAGTVKQLGGTSQPKQFADMIASSVSKSGMLPRIMEVMQAHSTLLQNINTTFKDGSSSQIMAYQTTLDKIGNANGMTKLTGEQGAGVISGLNGIFKPNNDKWQWEGIGALQQYDPKKYGKMGMYDLQSSFEDGLSNPDNLPAMAKQLKAQSGGNNDVFKRLMQSWLQDGGFNATKSQVTELDKVTGGFTAFDKGKIENVMGVNSGTAYDKNRKDDPGQNILAIEADFVKQLGDLGQKYLLDPITSMKASFTEILKDLNTDAGIGKTTSDILKFLQSSKLEYVFGAIGALKLLSWGSKLIPGGASTVPGAIAKSGKAVVAGAGAEAGAEAGLATTGSEIVAGGSGGVASEVSGAGGVSSEFAIGENLATKLTASETAQIAKLSGGDASVEKYLTQIFKSTGDMDAVAKVAGGNASSSEIIDMVSNGNSATEAKLTESFGKTGNISKVMDEANTITNVGSKASSELATSGEILSGGSKAGSEIIAGGSKAGSEIVAGGASTMVKTASELTGGMKILSGASKILSKIPLVGGLIDFSINKFMGDSNGKAGSKAVGMMGGSALGGLIGGGIGSLFGGVGAVPGAWLGGLIGGVGGGIGGDSLGGKAYDAWTEIDKKKAREASDQLKIFADKGTLDVKALSADGLNTLNDMRNKGLISFGELDSKGSTQIKSLSTEGAKELALLQSEGLISLDSMDTGTSKKLGEIATTHTTFLDRMSAVFKSIGDWIDKLLGITPKEDAPNKDNSWGSGQIAVPGDSGGYSNAVPQKYQSVITASAKKYGVSANMLAGMLETENSFNPTGTSSAGAQGIAQFIPETAKRYGVDVNDTTSSIDGMAHYMSDLIKLHGGNVNDAIRNYNGSGSETYKYLATVQSNMKLTAGNGSTSSDSNWNGTTYRSGSSGEDVKSIQEAVGAGADGIFGSGTSRAVKEWQRAHGLSADGIVGKDTWSAMFGGGGSKYNTGSGGRSGLMSGGSGDNAFMAVGSRFLPSDMTISAHQGEMLVPKDENPYANSGGKIMPSSEIINGKVNGSSMDVSKDAHITVDVNIKGEGASQLNNMTIVQLKAFVEQTILAVRNKNLSMNPTTVR